MRGLGVPLGYGHPTQMSNSGVAQPLEFPNSVWGTWAHQSYEDRGGKAGMVEGTEVEA